MRILIAHSFYRIPGGEDRYVSQQMELLSENHEVRLLGERNENLSQGAAAVRMIGSTSHRKKVASEIEAFAPDVIHVHNVYPALGPSVHEAAKDLRIPLVMTVHNYRLRCPNGLMFTEGEPCTRCLGGNHSNAVIHRCFPSRAQGAAYATALWVHRFVRKLEDDVSLFITPSGFMNETLVGWSIAADRVRTIRNFTDVPNEPSSLSNDSGLYLGRLSSEKGIDVLLRALAMAGDPPFTIAGQGPYEPALRALATQLGLKATGFVGHVAREEIPSLFERSGFLALPSIWDENAPLAALEAMAHGLPLLVTDKGGLPELADGGRGIVCAAADPAGLAAAIARMSVVAERSAMGAAARRFAEVELTRGAHGQALGSIYRELVGHD